MRGRRPKPTRMKVLTGNPGKRPLNPTEPRPEPIVPDCPVELGPSARRDMGEARRPISIAQAAHAARSGSIGGLLRRLRALGGSHRGHSKVRGDGEVTHRLSNAVALCCDGESSGRDHDADRLRIRLHAG
jgi:hypothetical protein